jgi:PKD repeat protein
MVCANGSVSFTDLSSADPSIGGCAIDTWSWDFGDGTALDPAQNPVHQYTASGIYDVSLTVTQGGGGCSGSDTKTRSAYIVICPYEGDFDGDTDVDGSDMATFYNDCLQAGSPPAWCDANGDGLINAADMDNLGRSDCVSCP